MINQYLCILVRTRKETGIQGQLIIHCKSSRTEHIVLLVMILKNSGVGLGTTMIHPISAIIQLSSTMVDENGLQSKRKKIHVLEDYGFEAS